jgi:hypothetical protein
MALCGATDTTVRLCQTNRIDSTRVRNKVLGTGLKLASAEPTTSLVASSSVSLIAHNATSCSTHGENNGTRASTEIGSQHRQGRIFCPTPVPASNGRSHCASVTKQGCRKIRTEEPLGVGPGQGRSSRARWVPDAPAGHVDPLTASEPCMAHFARQSGLRETRARTGAVKRKLRILRRHCKRRSRWQIYNAQ